MFKVGDLVCSIRPVGDNRVVGARGIIVQIPHKDSILVSFDPLQVGGWEHKGKPGHWWCGSNEIRFHRPLTPFETDLQDYLQEELR